MRFALMSEKRSGKKKTAILVMLVVLSAVFIRMSPTAKNNSGEFYGFLLNLITFPQRAAAYTWREARDFAVGIAGRGRIMEKNRELELEVETLRERLAELEDIKRRNERLRELLEFREQSGFEKIFSESIGAEVIGRNPLNWYHTLVIDRGRRDGVEAGMVVVGLGGVVGRIVEIGDSASRVMLILDKESRVSAVIERTGEHGIVAGRGDGVLEIIYLSDKSEIKSGDVVRTSGLGGIFPKGLTIGAVSKLLEQDYGLTLAAEVQPGADFSRLENVLILRN
jgi:rod shape-determining protein MreC